MSFIIFQNLYFDMLLYFKTLTLTLLNTPLVHENRKNLTSNPSKCEFCETKSIMIKFIFQLFLKFVLKKITVVDKYLLNTFFRQTQNRFSSESIHQSEIILKMYTEKYETLRIFNF